MAPVLETDSIPYENYDRDTGEKQARHLGMSETELDDIQADKSDNKWAITERE